jgi:hypothetical protein
MTGHILIERRQLSEAEHNLLEWLVAHCVLAADKYKLQVSQFNVVSMCGCGCPTVDFALSGARKSGASEIVSEARGTTPEGISVDIILHAREGELSELEVYSTSGLDGSFTLPSTELLKTY